jgi:hypothetical protein
MTCSISTLKNKLLIATLALLPIAAANASAQNKAIVNVPFAFVANHHVMPAGRYEVLSSDTSLTFIDANTRRTQAVLLSRHEAGDVIETQGKLRFLVAGSRYVLIEARFAGSSTHSELLAKPKLEGSVARGPEPATATVDVAMK